MKVSKKFNSKFITLFWCVLSTFPLIMFIVMLIGYFVMNKSIGANSDIMNENLLEDFLSHFSSYFIDFVPTFIYNPLASLFTTLGISSVLVGQFILIIFGWLITITLLHVFIDVILFLPRFCHNFLERWS